MLVTKPLVLHKPLFAATAMIGYSNNYLEAFDVTSLQAAYILCLHPVQGWRYLWYILIQDQPIWNVARTLG
jgi:hypothetical protein